MIRLHSELIIGSGRDKHCYFHPSDESRCVKILKSEPSAKKRMLREIKVHKKIAQQGAKYSYLSSYLCKVETNLGFGYIFEHIESFHKKIEDLDADFLKEKLMDIYRKCYIDALPMCEVRLDNLVLDKSGNFQIVDGLGWAEFIPICYWSKFFARRKIKRKFTKLINNLEERTSGWTHPLASSKLS
ncbi:MAG: YrbL family protein [Akkermansiaceae bacterium]